MLDKHIRHHNLKKIRTNTFQVQHTEDIQFNASYRITDIINNYNAIREFLSAL